MKVKFWFYLTGFFPFFSCLSYKLFLFSTTRGFSYFLPVLRLRVFFFFFFCLIGNHLIKILNIRFGFLLYRISLKTRSYVIIGMERSGLIGRLIVVNEAACVGVSSRPVAVRDAEGRSAVRRLQGWLEGRPAGRPAAQRLLISLRFSQSGRLRALACSSHTHTHSLTAGTLPARTKDKVREQVVCQLELITSPPLSRSLAPLHNSISVSRIFVYLFIYLSLKCSQLILSCFLLS